MDGAGAGATWSNSGRLYVGDYGTGTLNIENGGTVSNTQGYLGYQSSGFGTATVDGTGSTWSSSDILMVGCSGTGTLNIQNGGKVSSVGHAGGGYVGSFRGSNGTVTVDGTGSTWSSAQLIVGAYGTGTLNIQNGSDVSSGVYRGEVGSQRGSKGTVTVDGTGSTWSIWTLFVGYAGTGTLNIQNGGTVSNDGSGYVGSLTDSSGTATVDGTGSTWSNSGQLCVGVSGTGTLNIQNGGTVFTGGDSVIGYRSGSNGTVTLTGADSTWTNTGSLYVGGSSTSAGGSGTVYVNDGATLTVGDTLKIWSTGSVEVNNGTISAGQIENAGNLVYDGTFSGDVLIPSGGLLSGSGTFLGEVTIAEGATVSPGDSPGTMTWGSGLLEGGGTLLWEINHATGSPVTNWDLIAIDGTVSLTATDLNPFLIDIESLLPDNSPGLLGNFDNMQSYGWTFLTAAGGITGFSADSFSPDESGFVNDLGGGSFSVSQVGNSLKLNFVPIPEPSTLVLCGIGIVALLAYSRRRRKRAA